MPGCFQTEVEKNLDVCFSDKSSSFFFFFFLCLNSEDNGQVSSFVFLSFLAGGAKLLPFPRRMLVLSIHFFQRIWSLAEGSVSLRWSVEAMNFLKKMQIELLALCKKCKPPISFGAEEDWFNQYTQDTATLLDFCNSLKSAISGINRYRMVVELTIQKIVEGSPTCTISLEEMDLRKTGSENERFLSKQTVTETVSVSREIRFSCNSKTDKSIAAVMLAANCTMIVVSVLLVSAIVSPLSVEMGGEELIATFPQLKPFVEMLASLVLCFHERALRPRSGSRLVLAEQEMVDSVVGDLKAKGEQGGD